MAKYSCHSHSLPASAQTLQQLLTGVKAKPSPTACKALQTWPLSPPCPPAMQLSRPSPPPPRPSSTPGLCTAIPSAQNAGPWTVPEPASCLLSRLWLYCLLGKDSLVHRSEQHFSTPSCCSIFLQSPSPTPDIYSVCICGLLPAECLLH